MEVRWHTLAFTAGLTVAALVLPRGPRPAHATQGDGAQRDAFLEAVDAIGREALGADTAALIVAVDVEGDVLVRGLGAEDGQPDGDTLLQAGPLFSCFLSVAALALAEDGRLDLQSSLSEHLPELPYGALGVCVDHLLTHTSGIPGYGELLRSARSDDGEDDEGRILKWLRGGPLDSDPGGCANYSETDDLLLALVLQRVAGRNVAALLEELVFAPAGMESTAFVDEADGGSAGPVEHEFAGAFEDRAGTLPPLGAQRLLTTAGDLLRFQRALVEHRLLPESALELRATPPHLSDGSRADCGRGISLTGLGDQTSHSAGGGIAGERILLAYYPALDTTIVAWGTGDGPPVERIAARVARVLLDLETPVVRDLATSAEERARHAGDYYAGCTNYAVADEERHLVLYPPTGPRRVLLHQGGERFVASDDPDVCLEFESEGGRVVAFTLIEHGASLRARRLL